MGELKRLSYLEEVTIGEMFDPLGDIELRYYASDIMEKLGCEKDDEIDDAIHRVVQACQSLDIP